MIKLYNDKEATVINNHTLANTLAILDATVSCIESGSILSRDNIRDYLKTELKKASDALAKEFYWPT